MLFVERVVNMTSHQIKARNDALVSRTTVLEAELKAANDNRTRIEARLDALEAELRRSR